MPPSTLPIDNRLEKVFLSHDEDNSGGMDKAELESALNVRPARSEATSWEYNISPL